MSQPDHNRALNAPGENLSPDKSGSEAASLDAVRALFVVFHAAQSLTVMRALKNASCDAPLRRRDLNEKLPLASERAISNALDALKKAGLVCRSSAADGIGVHYFLSDAGREIAPLLESVAATCRPFSAALDQAVLQQRARRNT